MILNNESVRIHYNGEGERIKSHQMRASFVSKSINALEIIYLESYKEANRIYKSQINTEVMLEGGFSEGSLWWLMKLFSSETESQQPLQDKSIYNAVMDSVNRVINLLKKMDLSTTEIVIKNTSEGYEIDIDGERVIIDELQCAIITNTNIRVALSDLAMPLTEDGIDKLTISHGISEDQTIFINKKDKDNLVIKRRHKPKSKWKFISKDNPSRSITVLITDPKFLKRVSDSTETFSKDDLLEIKGVWYKEKTKLTGKLTIDYTVTEVKDHIPAEDRQWKLPI